MRRYRGADDATLPGASDEVAAPGQRTRTAPLQARGGPARAGETAHAVADRGTSGPAERLPFLDVIQRSFGAHDVGGVGAHVGGAASEAAGALGAEAYATGDRVAFARPPDLSTAAHEAAHVVQQRAGVSLAGGVGVEGDAHERHADQVADAVVRGESAQPLLDGMAGAGAAAGTAVQRKLTVTGRVTGEFGTPEDVPRLKRFVAEHMVPGLDDPMWHSAWAVSGLRHHVAAVTGADRSVDADVLQDEAVRARSLATAVGGSGLPSFADPESVTFADPDAAREYATKNVAGLEDVLATVDRVVVTNGGVDAAGYHADGGRDPGKLRRIEPTAAPTSRSRPGLAALNFGEVHHDADGRTLVLSAILGNSLREQFVLAVRVHGRNAGLSLVVDSTPARSEPLEQNYRRLYQFFEKDDEFRTADTIVFGYAPSFDGADGYERVAEKSAAGWRGLLYQVDGKPILVLDSSGSYHGEILAAAIQRLLESERGRHIRTVLAGGSAGSLLPAASDGEHLPPSTLFTPSTIMGPDGRPVANALAGHGQVEVPDSVHTSVVSALVETPEILADLAGQGVTTIDMEFGLVAATLNQINDARDDGKVRFGIACLVTDYPRTGAGDAKLVKKDEQAKTKAKARFPETVRSMLRA